MAKRITNYATLFRFCAALAGLLLSAPLIAQPLLDCPLRDAPFSTKSPLIDILLSPQAKAVVDHEVPSLLQGMPPSFFGTKTPTFASILTLKEAAGFKRIPASALGGLDHALAALPVTYADKVARCARYDTNKPLAPLPPQRPRVLLFEKITGFRDAPGVNAAHAMFVDIAQRKHMSIVTTEDGGSITPRNLARFDTVIWNNVSGDVLTLSQRAALRHYVEVGGGFIGVHGSAGDPVYFWDWYVDHLIGAHFIGHPIAKQFQMARLTVDPHHPLAKGLPSEWMMKDEWYSFAASPRLNGAHIIAALDEKTYEPVGMAGQDLRMGDHPIAWTKCVGKGRAFYSAIGHLPSSYTNPLYVTMIENALAWTSNAATPCSK